MSPELRAWEREVPELVNERTHTLFLFLQPYVIPIPSLEESVMEWEIERGVLVMVGSKQSCTEAFSPLRE